MKSITATVSILLCLLLAGSFTTALAQEKGKGDLEDFTDDYGEEESGDDDRDSDGSTEFFL